MNNNSRKKNKDLQLIDLISLEFLSLFVHNKQNVGIKFPKNISGYTFKKQILKERKDRPYKFALYENGEKKQAIAKLWENKYKDFDYHSLKNEITVYKKINNLLKAETGIYEKFPNLYIPEFIGSLETKSKLILLIEKAQGKTIEKIPVKEKALIYEKLINFMHELGTYLIKEKDPSIIERSKKDIILILLLASIKSIFKNPKNINEIIKVLSLFINRSFLFDKANIKTFVHRSLEDHNILVNGKKITLIDFQLAIIGDQSLEVANFLVFSWRNKELCRNFYKTNLMIDCFKNKTSFQDFKRISAYTGIHQIANGPKKDWFNNYSFLRYILSLTQQNVIKSLI